jgi:SAM-dependent methyltransferase
MNNLKCPVCGSDAKQTEELAGKSKPKIFYIYSCANCRFAFVANPILEFEDIYNEDYYRGRSYDRKIDYFFELENPDATIKYYEWRGVTSIVKELMQVSGKTRWLDYGCGNGGLTRYVRDNNIADICGYEEGSIAPYSKARGIPIIGRHELKGLEGKLDIVTAIEVLEHIPDPIESLWQIRKLLKPGGIFFFTTGNARPYRNKIAKWKYAVPEIHVSFFEPETLVMALKKTGFRPGLISYARGWEDIVHFKTLKQLGIRRRNPFEAKLPWGLIAGAVNKFYEINKHPAGWAV